MIGQKGDDKYGIIKTDRTYSYSRHRGICIARYLFKTCGISFRQRSDSDSRSYFIHNDQQKPP